MRTCKSCSTFYSDGQFDYQKDGYCSHDCSRRHSRDYRYCTTCGKRVLRLEGSWFCIDCRVKMEMETIKAKKESRQIRCDWCGKIYAWKDSTSLKRDVYFSKRCEAHL